MALYKQIPVKTKPAKQGYYHTDKGHLFWFADEEVWSCRDDRVSDEYPSFWYEELSPIQKNVLTDALRTLTKTDAYFIDLTNRCKLTDKEQKVWADTNKAIHEITNLIKDTL